MPRRRRKSKRRTLTPAEQMAAAIEEGLPPNPLVRQGHDFEPFAEDGTATTGAQVNDSGNDFETTRTRGKHAANG